MKEKCEICGATSSLEMVYACACDENSLSATLCKKCKEKYFDPPTPGVGYIPLLSYAENLVCAYRVSHRDDRKTKKGAPSISGSILQGFSDGTTNKKEIHTMQVTYNGFTGELVKMELRTKVESGPGVNRYDLTLYDSEKQATVSFTGVKLEDVKFLGGEVTFG